MKTAIIIPSRLGSTRLRQKPLIKIAGISLIERVYRQCKLAKGIDMVVIATDSDLIASHVNSFGAGAIMTPPECANGTERVAVAAKDLAEDFDIIINVQGDEPLVDPRVIEKLVSVFVDTTVDIATPVTRITGLEEAQNPNIAKIVADKHNNIMYFSRSVIPFRRDAIEGEDSFWKHIGLYAFRRDILQELRTLPPTEMEEIEKLEQLRWLYHGFKIRAVDVEHSSVEVNTEEDVRKVEEIIANNK